MKKKKHRKPTKPSKPAGDNSKYLSWWFIVPACTYSLLCLWINGKTLFEPEWWWLIMFAVIGFTVGIIRLTKDKEIVWNRKEYFGGFFYSLIHSVGGVIISLLLCSVIILANYYIPSSRPYYKEPAIVLSKNYYSGYRTATHYDVECQFENEKIGTKLINDSELYGQANTGDTLIFTLQNGFFNIPVIIDKTKQ